MIRGHNLKGVVMDLGIEGKVALVAASSTGIGRAVARALATEGCKVAICARRREPLLDAALAIERDTGADLFAVTGDVGVLSDALNITREVRARFGRIDILVNNAGGPRPGAFEDLGPDAWDEAFRLNLRSAVLLCREVVPGMKERRWGRIVNLTSISVKQPIDGLMLSNSLRAGVAGFSKTLANECGPFNVLVNTVCPGYTLTDRLTELAEIRAREAGTTNQEIMRTMAQAVPLRRIGEPGEIADLVAFLCSERAAYLTGTVIQVDGGLCRGLL
ncbi:MAG TPA: SDR family oxidoreductase [Patescibacteria group bacterium]|nr:SDR family oxidoreductase [Patescibacteria group bacterium]